MPSDCQNLGGGGTGISIPLRQKVGEAIAPLTTHPRLPRPCIIYIPYTGKIGAPPRFPAQSPSHQPFHPGLCVSLSRCRLPPVINHSTLTYVCYYPGADYHQSSTIPPWPMCVTIQVQTATSHQPFHPGLCVSLSRCRLPPVINHSTLAYVCHYPGADCHQSSTIPP